MISAPEVKTEQASGRPNEPLRMSFEDFLKWEHNGIAEWVNGEVTVMAVKNEHQRIVDFLNRLLGLLYLDIQAGHHSQRAVCDAHHGGRQRARARPDVRVR